MLTSALGAVEIFNTPLDWPLTPMTGKDRGEQERVTTSEDVNMTHYECRNLFGAGRTLLEKSGLVRCSGHSFVCAGDEDRFEQYWKDNFDPKFGRYMAWVFFSVGAENLVKAALVCNGVLQGKQQTLGYSYYSRDTDNAIWIDEVLQPQRGARGGYGTLGDIWKTKLDKLSDIRGIAETERNELKAAYKYFTQAIRNRDAHSYIENQRRRDFPAVDGIFVPAFNTLVQTMEDTGHFETTGNQCSGP